MIRRKRPSAHASHDRWLVSYADFITLLFAFFVVLYASAQVDQKKINRIAWAIQVAFQQFGVAVPPNAKVPLDLNQPIALPPPQEKPSQSPAPLPKPADINPEDDADLTALQSELEQTLQKEIQVNAVALHREIEGLVISLREFGFFDSGAVSLRPAALPALDRIASVLGGGVWRLRIEGHTDNVPIHTPQIASNWELSTARASELVRVLVVRYHFTPERLSAAGYAEFHPIASNATPQGRAKNRRVDLVVLSDRIVRRAVVANANAKPSAGIGPAKKESSPPSVRALGQ